MTTFITNHKVSLRPMAANFTSAPRSAGIKGLLTLVATWAQRRTSRLHLSRLTAFELEDIGLTHQDVSSEIAKPFWRA